MTHVAPRNAAKKRSRYRQLGLIGHGQFGRVYCAVNRQTGSLVALKDISRQRLSTHKFLRELRFLLTLAHPNIATCEALEHSDSGRQLVLDYCEGGTLRHLIEAEIPLTLEEILNLLREILAALDHAHSQGIVHCDIKPENILLKIVPGGWQVKLSDLGIARLKQEANPDAGQTGSPAYMAPERFYNQYSAASDLYAVGVILYELLLGRRPFSGTPAELMVAHLNHYPELPEELPGVIRSVLKKSLEKLLARRYQSAAEMRAAIAHLCQVLPKSSQACPLGPAVSADRAPSLPFVTLPHPVEVIGAIRLPLAAPHGEKPASQITILVACHQAQIWFYHWTGEQQKIGSVSQGFSLRSPIQSFVAMPQGGCFFTDRSIHLLTMGHGLTTVARLDGLLAATMSPDAQWLAAYRVEADQQAELILRRLPRQADGTVTTAPLHRFPLGNAWGTLVALTALDRRHLLVALAKNGQTQFQVFTRKGKAIAQLQLGTGIQQVLSTSQPYQFLALETDYPHHILHISLKPYRVLRYRLDIETKWLVTTDAGFCAFSQQGQFRLISDAGQVIARLDGLPRPNAVLPVGPLDCLLAVSEAAHSRIYQLNLSQLELDLIF